MSEQLCGEPVHSTFCLESEFSKNKLINSKFFENNVGGTGSRLMFLVVDYQLVNNTSMKFISSEFLSVEIY